jgi:hypothetical protein
MDVGHLLCHFPFAENVSIVAATGLPIAMGFSMADLSQDGRIKLFPTPQYRFRERALQGVRESCHVRRSFGEHQQVHVFWHDHPGQQPDGMLAAHHPQAFKKQDSDAVIIK